MVARRSARQSSPRSSYPRASNLELGGHKWEVVRAEPMSRAEYAKSCRLTIVMRKIEVARVPSKDILFSLPTINDALPGIAPGSTKLGMSALELHEDDWRQVEFVARELGDVVAGELTQIRRILGARTGPGFREIHVRKQPTSPLVERHITVDEVARSGVGGRVMSTRSAERARITAHRPRARFARGLARDRFAIFPWMTVRPRIAERRQ